MFFAWPCPWILAAWCGCHGALTGAVSALAAFAGALCRSATLITLPSALCQVHFALPSGLIIAAPSGSHPIVALCHEQCRGLPGCPGALILPLNRIAALHSHGARN
jgi:hypothetical protein